MGRWTGQELTHLHASAGRRRQKAIARDLNKSEHAIAQKAKNLGGLIYCDSDIIKAINFAQNAATKKRREIYLKQEGNKVVVVTKRPDFVMMTVRPRP